ncbi:DUF3108 domain-containing protein [Aquabacterium sp.]|uniref:DUF3108 domain-containing protein n=1 Tax=Aquabacterium sp. TaxID=1872578 RepID=UPI003D6D8CD0
MSGVQSGSRRWWLLGLVLGVVLVHAWLTWSMAALLKDMQTSESPGIKPMEATYLSELKLSDPPVLRPSPPLAKPGQPPRQQAAKAMAQAASTPEQPPPPAESESASEPEAALTVAEAASPAASPASADPILPVAESATASEPSQAPGPPFVWPVATRVSYKVRGYFRGEVHGSAKVEWVRQGLDYQVRVNAIVGPSFAPIGSWHLISAGTITPAGLSPKRFEQVDRLLIRTSLPRTVVFEEEQVVLDSGERVARQPNMQDASSQFIQLAYQFMMKPEALKPGNTIYLPLALPKRAETIAYDVVDEQVLDTPIGKVPTFHVKPRKLSAEGGVLPVEIWFAPGLQYLPVRILVHGKDGKSYMDMQMERAPEQTKTEADAARPTPSN